jgi:hypothetical protein
MTIMEIMLAIITEMDDVNDKELLWTKRQFAKLYANVHMMLVNGIEFTPKVCRMLAEGKENHKVIREMQEMIPIHYKHINGVLDDVYEQKRTFVSDSEEQTEGGVRSGGEGSTDAGAVDIPVRADSE